MTENSESGRIEWDLDNRAVGPRVLVWGDVEIEAVDHECPAGWSVDWATTPAPLSSTRNGERGFAHPLMRDGQSVPS